MTTFFRNLWQNLVGGGRREAPQVVALVTDRPRHAPGPQVDIAPDDPIVGYFQMASGAVEIDKLDLASPGLRALKAAGVKLAVPLVSQGELIGLLNLGPRLSEQDYSADDRALLSNLATQAGPAVRVAQLVRQQQIEAQTRERLEQELRVARLIQQTLLPKEMPNLPGWSVAGYYQPARAVGGDFYDFLTLADGRLGLVVGDVTDKGVPAALVMATTRAIMRGAARQFDQPGQVLERANELLVPDIPRNMFVTCLYAILDPQTGRLVYANAGHDLPYRHHQAGADELRATGMPLGLLPGMIYEEKETIVRPGETIVFYSDGLVEAHNAERAMFSFGRLQSLVGGYAGHSADLVKFLLDQLAAFTGPDWEQEDDVTLVTLERAPLPEGAPGGGAETEGEWRTLAHFQWSSEPGNERLAMAQVAAVVKDEALPPERLERLKTGVAEATMNAMEHGNKFKPEVPVDFVVLASPRALAVRITDYGGAQVIPEAQTPNLEAKLAGEQTPRGWGLFLIEKMVDEVNVTAGDGTHTLELVMYRGGGQDGH
ncbi:MAG: SpoIIE family protein phosphatase [Anaerolineales bacterium]|nr:SpoIIE family protein phosphatase [Anaerolineales bacterium]